MAGENKIFALDRKYLLRETVGGVMQYYRVEFKGAIPLRTILDIVCKLALEGDCRYYEIKHGPVNKPLKVVIDKDQYDDLMAFANA